MRENTCSAKCPLLHNFTSHMELIVFVTVCDYSKCSIILGFWCYGALIVSANVFWTRLV